MALSILNIRIILSKCKENGVIMVSEQVLAETVKKIHEQMEDFTHAEKEVVIALLFQMVIGGQAHQLPDSLKEDYLTEVLLEYANFVLENPFEMSDLDERIKNF